MTDAKDRSKSNHHHHHNTTGNPSVDTLINLVAGGMGGTAGAILTCPLEVVKTRLQSSNSGFGSQQPGKPLDGFQDLRQTSTKSSKNLDKLVLPDFAREKGGARGITVPQMRPPSGGQIPTLTPSLRYSTAQVQMPNPGHNASNNMNVIQCLRYIVDTEGPRGLFKGLGPNLVGVAPSRAIYFFTYSTAKKKINDSLPRANRDTPFVHVVSAACAGFSASTCTNPIWLIKTRLQLDRASGNKTLTVRKCVMNIYQPKGIRGFWKGVTASYWGISETVIHFVIYEFLKKQVTEYQNKRAGEEKSVVDFFGFMFCGACSKTVATMVAYPHEVARTRMREEGTRYRSFWQTLALVAKEEGRAGLYRGLVTQLIRQIPNTAVMMFTYELTVYGLTKAFRQRASSLDETSSQQSHSQ